MGRYAFKLPDVGEGIAEAEIVAWHVKPGDEVREDQPLVDVMTDKATVEIPSPRSGRVVSLQGDVGAQAAVGSVIVVMEVEAGAGGSADLPVTERQDEPPLPSEQSSALSAGPAVGGPAPRMPSANPPAPAPTLAGKAQIAEPLGRPLASPAVRRRALDLGVRLELVAGTGPSGRITQDDLLAFLQNPAGVGTGSAEFRPRDGVEVVKVIGLRRTIATRMAEAKRRIPHFAYIEEVDVTELERLRAQLNSAHAERQRLTILPFLARALVRTLPLFPQINARFDDDAGEVHRHAAVHLGVATQTPTGLVVPVVRHAEGLDLWQTAEEVRRLAEAARQGKAKREELVGSTITITSLGTLGGLATTPVINAPEVAIIGPNRIIERPVVVGGAVTVRKLMNLSSSFDHRVVDGWDAAEFIQRMKTVLETPALLFVERP